MFEGGGSKPATASKDGDASGSNANSNSQKEGDSESKKSGAPGTKYWEVLYKQQKKPTASVTASGPPASKDESGHVETRWKPGAVDKPVHDSRGRGSDSTSRGRDARKEKLVLQSKLIQKQKERASEKVEEAEEKKELLHEALKHIAQEQAEKQHLKEIKVSQFGTSFRSSAMWSSDNVFPREMMFPSHPQETDCD